MRFLKFLELGVWLVCGLIVLISGNITPLHYGLCWGVLMIKISFEAIFLPERRDK